ncbi:ImmA/IrrE family metallo-endopeptidase [Roseburia sp. MUC/MUC-530-WT-4D]|uniref:ImmA/IrrE family metallo-endopeptidase n=1 Tax=Roseburia porci TaxID=2605790 RepID=A0A6L5YMF8_9FIRM|nr:ImmA/IrrE family metallo-endopeptidase [Roseburia porci]MST73478.1 ImmA/IrrE family metallo-endopeptidase [Roseburia porci]
MENVSVEPMSRKSIRNIVMEFRKLFGLENTLFFPIVEFIEWCLPELGLDFEILDVCEMRDTYGLTNMDKNTLYIREDVYIGAKNGVPRDRFTLCHELGHALLHTPDRVSFARGEIPAYRDPEWQANTFAGELMAPYSLTRNMSPQEISDKCGMSLQAAKIQYDSFRK